MGLVTKNHTFSTGKIKASEHNDNFDTLYTLVNGNINNDNVTSGAGIVEAKITFAATGHTHAGGANGNAVALSSISTASAVKGDIIYYTGTAWARLGTGSAGQTLKISSGLPSWA